MAQGVRRNKRFDVRLLGLVGIMDDEYLVTIVDMSVGGIALNAERRPARGRQCALRLYDQGSHIDVQGTVVRSRIARNSRTLLGNSVPVYAAALKLHEGQEEQVADFICGTLLR